jgi:hypothetical protein
MGNLSELVRQDYDAEVEIIRDAGGNLWLVGLGAALFFAAMWGVDLLLRAPWTKKEIGYAMICGVAFPFINRAWERHKVAAKMRHEREVRVEVKLNALLGLVNIKDDDDDE